MLYYEINYTGLVSCLTMERYELNFFLKILDYVEADATLFRNEARQITDGKL